MSEVNLNLELLSELAEVMGDDMSMLIESYVEDSLPKIIQLLELNIETEQDAIYKMAHSLKGSSRNVGVIEFSNYCENIEKLAREGQLTEQDLDRILINSLFDEARSALEGKFLE